MITLGSLIATVLSLAAGFGLFLVGVVFVRDKSWVYSGTLLCVLGILSGAHGIAGAPFGVDWYSVLTAHDKNVAKATAIGIDTRKLPGFVGIDR